jgi:hypothetical protein
MSRETFERGEWQGVIAGHQLESHDPAEWLRYGVALLQTIEPGTDVGKQQQQMALAFVQAAKEGAPPEAVQAALRQSVLLSVSASLHLIGLELPGERAKSLAKRQGRMVNRSMRQAAIQSRPAGLNASSEETPYHYRTAIPLRFSYMERRDNQLILASTHNYGYFSCLSTILWDLITCSNYGRKPTLISGKNGMKDFKDQAESDLFQIHFSPPEKQSLQAIPSRKDLPIPAHHGDYRCLDLESLKPFLEAYFKPLERIDQLAQKLMQKYAINPEKTSIVCYRGTDKSREVPPVPAEEYLLEAEDILEQHPGFRVLVQTDQKQIRDHLLESLGEKAFAVDELPVTEGDAAIHFCLDHGRQDFADHLLAINLIMAKSCWVITHTGNVAFWTVLLRGHCERVVQFGALAEP